MAASSKRGTRGKNKKGFLRLSNDEVAMIEGDEDFSGSEIELLDISHMSGSSGGAKEPIETRQAVASSSDLIERVWWLVVTRSLLLS